MTAPGATEFDRATAVAPLGGGAWTVDIDAGWFAGRGPNGGYLAATVLRAMVAELDDPAREPRSLTCHYLRPPAAGPARIDVTVERSGRATSTLTARLAQDGRECVLGVAAFGIGVPAPADYAGAPPAVPGPEQVPAADNSGSGLSIVSRFEVRPALGGAMFAGADEALTGGWLRFSDARGTDAIALAMFADAWFPAPWVRLRGPVAARGERPRARRAGARGVPLDHRRRRLLRGGRRAVDARRRLARAEPPARAARAPRPGRGMTTGYLGLGSNVGDRRANLQAAVDALPGQGVTVLASSSAYDTDPVGLVLDQPAFLNACVRIDTDLEPEALLDACKAVERDLGRDLEGGVRHGPRPIDVDLLLLGDTEYRSDRLSLPHEQVTARRFVLIPLLELDFDLRTPDGTRLSDCLARMPLDEGVRRAGGPLVVQR